MSVHAGILTGISYVSGLDYYRGIHERVLAVTPVGHLMPPNPPLTMVSVDCDEYARLLTARDFDGVASYLLDGVDQLVATGCDLLVIASNTGHICVPAVEQAHPQLRVLHIADCSAHQLKEMGVTKVGLVGTQPTMEESYLHDRLAQHGISTMIPDDVSVREEIYRIIYEELSLNEFRPQSRDTVVEAIRELGRRGAEACILGCTEIELLVQQEHVPELSVLPSAEAHMQFAADIIVGELQVEDVLPVQAAVSESSAVKSDESAVEAKSGWGGPIIEPIPLDEIRRAADTIAAVARRTPLVPLRSYGPPRESSGIHLKLETVQDVGSFKIRGVYNWLSNLTAEQRAAGLNTHSAGNTAQALGYAALRFGCDAQTLVPDRTPQAKLDAIHRYGVETVPVSMDDLLDFIFSAGWTQESKAYLNPWGDTHMIAGNATIALEILQERPDLQSIYVPVGGGGLLAGIGSAVKALGSSCRVVAVQVDSCQALSVALEQGRPTWVPMGDSLSDISLPVIVDELFPLLQSVVDEVVTVGEAELAEAVRLLAVENKVVAEGAGALALAGALQSDRDHRGESACLVTGGSIDPLTLAEILSTS